MSGPIPAVHGVVRWRLVDLIQWLWEEFRITISKQTLSRELRALGYRKLSARPRHHAKSEAAVSAFKKTSPPVWRRSRERRAAASRIEIWFADEARVGQKNKITRRWAARHAALGAQGPTHGLGLHLRGHLPGSGQGRRPGPAPPAPPRP